MPLNGYAIRVARSYDEIKTWVQTLDENGLVTIVYEHVGEKSGRVHCHLAWYGEGHKNTLKKWGDNLGLSGNKDWSYKMWDTLEKYVIYMTKGQHDPKYVNDKRPTDDTTVQGAKHRYTQQRCTELKALWEDRDPPSQAEILYAQIDKQIWDSDWQWWKSMNEYDLTKEADVYFDWLLQKIRWLVRANVKTKVWTPGVFMLYKTMVYTYCLDNEVYIPESRKEWRRYI